jgi:hypothetical protein
VEKVLEKVIEEYTQYDWLRGLKCKETTEYIILEVLDQLLQPNLRKEDLKVYETLKVSLVPDY